MSGNAHATEQGAQMDLQNLPPMDPALDFEDSWRDLRPRIVSMLVRRGTPKDVAEDVAQETAIRLLKNWHLLDETRPTWPFARRIALNCLVDRHRREHFDTVGTVPDREGPHDVEEHSLARFRLTEVWRAMAGLSQRERSILLAEVGVATGFVNDSATKMARHRARQKLTAAVGQSGAFSVIPLTWRRFTGWVHLHGQTYVDVGAAAGLAVIVSAAAVTWGQVGHAATRSRMHPIRSEHAVARGFERERPSQKVVVPRPRPAGHRVDATAAPTKPPKAAASPTASPEPTPYTNTKAGPARAETGTHGGAIYVKVCTGEETQTTEDDFEVTVVVPDGTEEPQGQGPSCHHGGSDKP